MRKNHVGTKGIMPKGKGRPDKKMGMNKEEMVDFKGIDIKAWAQLSVRQFVVSSAM